MEMEAQYRVLVRAGSKAMELFGKKMMERLDQVVMRSIW